MEQDRDAGQPDNMSPMSNIFRPNRWAITLDVPRQFGPRRPRRTPAAPHGLAHQSRVPYGAGRALQPDFDREIDALAADVLGRFSRVDAERFQAILIRMGHIETEAPV